MISFKRKPPGLHLQWLMAISTVLNSCEQLLLKTKDFVSFVDASKVPSPTVDTCPSPADLVAIFRGLRDLFYLFHSAAAATNNSNLAIDLPFSRAMEGCLFGIGLWINGEVAVTNLLKELGTSSIQDVVGIIEICQTNTNTSQHIMLVVLSLLTAVHPLELHEPICSRMLAIVSSLQGGSAASMGLKVLQGMLSFNPSDTEAAEPPPSDQPRAAAAQETDDGLVRVPRSTSGTSVTVPPTIASRSYHIAVNAISELLRFGPLSTSWLQQGGAKEGESLDETDDPMNDPLCERFNLSAEYFQEATQAGINGEEKNEKKGKEGKEREGKDVAVEVMKTVLQFLPQVTSAEACSAVLDIFISLIRHHAVLEHLLQQQLVSLVDMLRRVVLSLDLAQEADNKRVYPNFSVAAIAKDISVRVVCLLTSSRGPGLVTREALLPLLSLMLDTAEHPLILAATDVCSQLLRAAPTNQVALEAREVDQAVFSAIAKVLVHASFTSSGQEDEDEDEANTTVPDDVSIISITTTAVSEWLDAPGKSSSSLQHLFLSVRPCLSSLLVLLDLVHVMSVITASRDCSPLSFLVSAAVRLVDVRCAGAGLPRSNISLASTELSDAICHNCESEPACFKCLQVGCPCSAANCSLCDQVFHKAVAKRNHIRIPIVRVSSFMLMMKDVTLLVREQLRICLDDISSVLVPHRGALGSVVLSLVLAAIRGMIDDRRTRRLYLPGVLLAPVLSSMVNTLTDLSVLDLDLSLVKPSDPEIAHFLDLLTNLASYRKDCLVDPSDVTYGNIDALEQTGGDTHANSHRICISLFLQIVSRFFVVESITPARGSRRPSSESGEAFLSGQQAECCDPRGGPAEMYARLKVFRKLGCDALLVHLLTAKRQTVLTRTDRQFAVWLLREVVVSAMEVDKCHAVGLMQWLAWMLRGPLVENGPSSADPIFSAMPFAAPEEELSLAPMPASPVDISVSQRALLVQELRLLLAGDHLPSLSSTSDSSSSSKLLFIPWISEGVGSPILLCHAACRVPISCNAVAALLVEAGLLEPLLESTLGSHVHTLLRSAIFSPSTKSSEALTDAVQAEWLGSVAVLCSLIAACDAAKDRAEATVGLPKLLNLLQPIAQHTKAPKCLINLVLDLCISGASLSPSSRPFICCGKLDIAATLSNRITPDNMIFGRLNAYDKLTTSLLMDLDDSSVAHLAPVYLTCGRAVCMTLQVVRSLASRFNSFSRPGLWTKKRSSSSDARLARNQQLEEQELRDEVETRSRSSFHSQYALGLARTFTPTPSVQDNALSNRPSMPDMASLHSEDYRSQLPSSSGPSLSVYIPVAHALNWGLAHCMEGLMQTVYEALLLRGAALGVRPSSASLVQHALRKHLQIFVPTRSISGSYDIRPLWLPRYSCMALRSAQSIDVLLAMMCNSGNSLQEHIFLLLSSLIAACPSCAEELFLCGVQQRLVRLIASVHDGSTRTLLLHLLGKLMQYSSDRTALQGLLAMLQLNASWTTEQPSSITCDILKTIEFSLTCLAPSSYLHFTQANVFSSRRLLPPILLPPTRKVGLSIVLWLRLTHLGGLAPFLSLLQIKKNGDSAEKDSDKKDKSSTNVYFRVAHCVAAHADKLETASATSNISYLPHEVEQAALESETKRVLQLCISRSGGTSQLDPKDNALLASILVPELLVDLDFEPSGAWQLLVLSISDAGLLCHVDGEQRGLKHWSPLGYTSVADDSELGAQFLPHTSKEQPFVVSLGGMYTGAQEFAERLAQLNPTHTVRKSPGIEGELRAAQELQNLLCLRSIVSGFSGDLGELLVCEGALSDTEIRSMFESGPMILFPKPACRKILTSLVPSLLPSSDLTGSSRQRLFDGQKSSSVSSPLPSRLDAGKGGVSAPGRAVEESGGLVNDLMTMFIGKAGTGADDLAAGQTVSVCGCSIRTHHTHRLVEAVLSQGGYGLWYPLLSSHSTARSDVALLVAAMVNASPSAEEAFERPDVKAALLYCLHAGQDKSSEVLQALLAMSTRSRVVNSSRHRLLKSSECIITRLSVVQLALHLVMLCPMHFCYANFLVIWLRDVNEDNFFKNTQCLLGSIGLLPFLHLMTLWGMSLEGSQNLGSLSSSPSRSHQLEGSKFQLRMSKILKQFIGSECGHFSIKPAASPQLPSGFDASHLLTMLTFCVHSLRSSSSLGSGSQSRKFSNSAPAAVVHAVELVLDALGEMVVGSSLVLYSSFVRSPVAVGSVWQLLLCLLGCPYMSVRLRTLRLLVASLATAERRIDIKQILAFEKINGFATLADQLSLPSVQPSPALVSTAHRRDLKQDEELLVSSLLDLMFWKLGDGEDGQEPQSLDAMDDLQPTESTDGLDEDIDQPVSNALENIGYLSSSRDAVVGSSSFDVTGSHPASSSLFSSIFSWQPTAVGKDCLGNADTDPLVVEGARSAVLQPSLPGPPAVNISTVVQSSGPTQFPAIAPTASTTTLRAKNLTRSPARRAKSPVYDPGVPPSLVQPSSRDKTEGRSREHIQLPQTLQVILRCLRVVRSSNVVLNTANRICASLAQTQSEGFSSPSLPLVQNLASEDHVIAMRNFEALTANKDWLLWVAEALQYFDHTVRAGALNDSASCLSDTSTNSCFSKSDEDDRASVNIYESHSNFEAVMAQYSDPLLNLVQTIMFIDIRSKPGPTRKYQDLFRLPLPDLHELQIMMLFDLLEAFEYSPMTDTDVSFHLLRNLAGCLDGIHERTEMPLEFCVRAVQVLNIMSYKALPVVRVKIKDTALTETRNLFVVRCLLDRTEDVDMRIAAVLDMHRSVDNLLASAESKLLSESQILVSVFGLFIDVTNELEFTSSSDSRVNQSETASRCQVAIKLQIALLQIIISCTTVSEECRKTVLKLFLPIDSSDTPLLLATFIKSYQSVDVFQSAASVTAGAAIASPAQSTTSPLETKEKEPVAPFNEQERRPSSWWGSWASNKVDERTSDPSVASSLDSPRNESTRDQLVEDRSVVSFVQWFNSIERENFRTALRNALIKDLQALDRVASKLFEKSAQRRAKFIRQLQDKCNKDRQIAQKAVRDSLDKAWAEGDSRAKKYHLEREMYLASLAEMLERGSREVRKSTGVLNPMLALPNLDVGGSTSISMSS